jgi:SAM-dependent methyltransferase
MAVLSTSVRRVEPEWLDTLRPDDPRAVRARRDLRRVNAWMMQSGIMARLLLRSCAPARPRQMLDLGCGDGTFMLRVARQLAPHWPYVTVILVDRQNIVSPDTRRAFRALQWRVEPVAADVFDYLERSDASQLDVMTVNLFLHHFRQQELERLLELAAQRTRLFIACEPRRTATALLASRMLWAIGCDDVTRHDAAISVQAGFRGRELSTLWPNRDAWDLDEHPAKLFTHCFVARRFVGPRR